MNPIQTAEYLLSQDAFSQWMGVKILDIKEKYCHLEMQISPEMINGLKTVHGGVIFAFADTALAFSSNNTGEASVAIHCAISFLKAVKMGETLYAESTLIAETRKTGVYDISIKNGSNLLIASFRGTVYKIGKNLSEL